MTTAYTSLLGLALPVQGELSGTWGDTVNNSITSLLDTSVAGTTNVSTDTDVTLTTTTGAANTARQAILLFSGARTALRTVTAPAQSKIYTVINATTGGFSVKLVGSGPTTGLTIPNGASAVVAWNGSDFVEVGAGSIGNLVVNGTLTVTGATTLQSTLAVTGNITNTAGTANGVTYLNGSKVLSSSATLTWNNSTQQLGFQNAAATGYAYIGTAGAGSNTDLAFYMGASEGMRLTSTGLGIGTSSPATKLQVSANEPKIRITSTAGSGKSWDISSGGNTTVTLGHFSIYDTTTDAQRFNIVSGTGQMLLDGSGNLGLGVTPSAWDTVYQAIQLPNGGSISGYKASAAPILELSSNQYYDGGYKYVISAAATKYAQNQGVHSWSIAPSGTAGNTITFTQAMTLDASGNLGIGTSSPTNKLDILTGDNTGLSVRSTNYSGTFGPSGLGGMALTAAGAYPLFFYINGATRATLDSSGNLGLGVTPSAWSSSAKALEIGIYAGFYRNASGITAMSFNSYQNTSNADTYRVSSNPATKYEMASGHAWYVAPSGTAGNAITFTQAMTLDASGNLGVGTTSPAYRLDVAYNANATNFIRVGNTTAGASSKAAIFSVSDTSSGQFGTVSSTWSADPVISVNETYAYGAGGLLLYSGSTNPLRFATNGSERARIDSSGRMLVGATSFTSYGTFNSYTNTTFPSGRFVGGPSTPDGNIVLMVDKYSSTNTTSQWFLGFTIGDTGTASGVITANGASQATFTSWSDRRLKENIVDLAPQLANIMALRPVEFDYIESEGGGHQISFIAQEFEEIYPDAIGARPDGMKTLSGWAKTEAILVKAIQEQQAIIESLKARLDAANL